MFEPISINTLAPQEQGINIDLGSNTNQLDQSTASARAVKARFGMSGVMPDKAMGDWYSDIISGREDESRKEDAASVDINSRNRQVRAAVQGDVPPPFTSADPSSVWEQQFSSEYIKPLIDKNNQFTSKSFMSSAMEELPDVVKQSINIGQNGIAIGQYIDTQLENLQGQYSKTQAFMLGAIPFAQSIAMRMPALKFGGLSAALSGFLGQNEDAQASALFRQDFNAAKGQIDTVIRELGPTLAYQWLSKMKSQSTDERIIDNSFDILDLTTLGSIGFSLAKDVVGASKNVVRSTRDLDPNRPIEVQQAAARGDQKEAAVQTASQEILDATKNPETGVWEVSKNQATNSLLDVFRVDQNAVKKSPGTYGQDIVNRIDLANDNFVTALAKRIDDAERVNRTPREIAREDVVRGEVDRIKGQFRGAGNAVLDITGPHYEEVSPGGLGKPTNTYWYEVRLGTFDGEYHANRKQAELFAELHRLEFEPERFGHEPIAGMNKAPIEYKNFTEFRAAARAAGVKDKDLKKASVNSSMAFERAKASQVRTGGYEIKQEGGGYYISIPKPAMENTPHMIAALSTTTETRQPHIWSNHVPIPYFDIPNASYLRTPVDTLSWAETGERRTAAHTPSIWKQLSESENEIMGRVPQEDMKRLQQLMDYGRDLYDKEGNKGYFYESPQEVEDWHQLFFDGQRPSQALIEGYFAWKRLGAFDLALRDMMLFKNMSISGAENHYLTFRKPDGSIVKSDEFQAIPRQDFPNGPDTLLILGEKGEPDWIGAASSMIGKKRGIETGDKIRNGEIKLVEVYAPRQRQLKGWRGVGHSKIRWVAGRNIVSKPLDVSKMIPRRGGGHFDYDYEHYLKQPIVTRDEHTGVLGYEGDSTLMPMEHQGVGREFEEKFNVVRQYMHAGMHDEARKIIRDLPVPEDDHYGWYFEKRNEQGHRIPPLLNTEWPIRLVPKDKMTIDLDDRLEKMITDEHIRDYTKSGGADAQFQVQYTGERDAHEMFTIRPHGTKANPLYAYEPAKLVNPIKTSGRALNRAINSLYNDDMKNMSMKHWLKEAQPYLKATEDEIWHSPWWYFNAKDIWRNGADPDVVARLEGNRRKIQLFEGARNKVQTQLHTADSKLAESLYKGFGPKGPKILPTHWLPLAKDPAQTVRSFTVHQLLGLFNLPSMWVQGFTAGNVLAFAGPRHAMPGLSAAMMARWFRINKNPAFIDHVDKIMTSLGHYRRGEFAEMIEGWGNSGFHNVRGEHGYIDDPLDQRFIMTAGKKILDWGMFPFRYGAEFVRDAAYFTAYHEYRHGSAAVKPGRATIPGATLNFVKNLKSGEYSLGEASKELVKSAGGERLWNDNPFGKISREDWTDIKNRAGWLDHNMSRVANAPPQSGAGSVPMLFMSYRLRLTEALWGRTFSPLEKARLLAFSALLYGIPFGPLGLVGVPLGYYMRKKAFESGMYGGAGESWWKDIAMGGILQAGLGFITGTASEFYTKGAKKAWDEGPGEWYKQGNFYNPGERYGNAGLADEIARDQGIIGILGGAPLSHLQDMAERFSPLARDILYSRTHIPSASSYHEALKTLNGYAAVSRTVTGAMYHGWWSKNGTKLTPTDVSIGNAIFMGASGLTDQRSADAYTKTQMLAERKETGRIAMREAMFEWHRFMDARKGGGDKDNAQADHHRDMTRTIYEMGGLPMDKYDQFLIEATNSYGKNIVDTTNEKFYGPDNARSDKEATEYNEILKQIERRERKRGER